MRVGCEDEGDSSLRRDKTDSLEAVKANIMQDSKLCKDFERCVKFYKYFIKSPVEIRLMKRGGLLKSVRIRNGTMASNTSTIQKKNTGNFPPMPRKNSGIFLKGHPQAGRPQGGSEKGSKQHKNIRKVEQKAKKFQGTIKKLEAKRVDDNNKSNSSDCDDLSVNDAAGTNRNHPALMHQATGKGESKRGGKKQEWTGWGAGETVTFGKGVKFTAKGRKKVATVRSVQIKVSNSSVTDEIRMYLSSHVNTCVLGKECLKVYDCNRPVNLYGCNPKYRERLCQTISGLVDYYHPQSG